VSFATHKEQASPLFRMMAYIIRLDIRMNRDYDSMDAMAHLDMWPSKSSCEKCNARMDQKIQITEKKMDTAVSALEEEIRGLRETLNNLNKRTGNALHRLDDLTKYIDKVDERLSKNKLHCAKIEETMRNTIQNLGELSESLVDTESLLRSHVEKDEEQGKVVQRLVSEIDKHEKNMERLARDSSRECDTLSDVMQIIELIKERIGLNTTPSPVSRVPSWGYSYSSNDEENRDGSFEYSESEPGDQHRDTPSPRNPDMNPRSNDSRNPDMNPRSNDSRNPDMNPRSDDSDSGNDWDEGSHLVRRGGDGSFSFAS